MALLGGAIGSKELVQKILGPTADYLGGGLANWTQRAVKNTGRVFENAARKLGGQIDKTGAVPPNVLKGILENAPFCDDELGAEYFGGVLASSRTQVGRDDRGAAFISLVERLSTYEIRAHFVFYSAIRSLYQGLAINIAAPAGRWRLETFIPTQDFAALMEFGVGENFENILAHVMFGLTREALIDANFGYGPLSHIKGDYPAATTGGVLFTPSPLGTDFFLWAHGRGDLNMNNVLDAHLALDSGVKLSITPGIRSTRVAAIANQPSGETTKMPTS